MRVGFALAAALLATSGFGTNAAKGAERLERDGLIIELSAHGLDGVALAEVPAGDDVLLRFSIASAATSSPLPGLRPAVWIDERSADGAGLTCQEKIRSFLQGSIAYRPQIDLNAWYVLALNAAPSITVIDPLLQFGGQKVVTLVPLQSAGADWVMTKDGKTLFVTLPDSDRVAVVDTLTWKVVDHIPAGSWPTRAALQPDGKYLWIARAFEDGGGVSIVDAETRAVVAETRTGHGPHDIAFSADSRHAFVSSAQDGSVSVIDVGTLQAIARVPIEGRPIALAASGLGRAVYVAAEAGGVTVFDSGSHRRVTRIGTPPGLRGIGVSPDGRWVLATNAVRGEVTVIDAASNRIVRTLDVGAGADQITFTPAFAYVRTAGDETVSLIPWTQFASGQAVAVQKIPAGRAMPATAADASRAMTIAPTPGERSVLIGSRSDRAIHYYNEGMNAPMGSFSNLRPTRGVLAADRSLRETAPGILESATRLPKGGVYDVAFLLNAPRIIHCFTLAATGGPEAGRPRGKAHLEYLVDGRIHRAGETVRVRVRLSDPTTREPIAALEDLTVMSVLVPGTWQRRQTAQAEEGGVYAASVALPKPGVYHVHVQSAALRAQFQDFPYLVLKAEGKDDAIP
jgi:YVTN family beta-propeller protein